MHIFKYQNGLFAITCDILSLIQMQLINIFKIRCYWGVSGKRGSAQKKNHLYSKQDACEVVDEHGEVYRLNVLSSPFSQ